MKYKVISLFSGAGGMDLGFIGGFSYLDKYYKGNNFEIIYANEIDKNACMTYEKNFNHNINCDDINNLTNLPPADIILGGFPCQDFSLAGKMRGLDASRGRLYLEMIRVIKEVSPLIFVAENVENLAKINNKKTIETIISDFSNSGYNVYFKVYDMSEYGVPQTRKRVIIYGIKRDFDFNFEEVLNKDKYIVSKKLTSFDAIDDLWDTLELNQQNLYSKAKFRYNSKLQGNIKINKDKPSPTIRAEHHGNIEGHYRTKLKDENDINGWRRLTPRECARLQTFPDDFVFPVSASSAYKQIGNAVPPVFAWIIANQVQNYLLKMEELKIERNITKNREYTKQK